MMAKSVSIGNKFRLRLTGKLVAVIAMILISVQLLISGLFWTQSLQRLQLQHEQQLQQMQINIAQAIAIDVWNFNPGSLQVLLAPHLNNPAVSEITVIDLNDNTLRLPNPNLDLQINKSAHQRLRQPLFLTMGGEKSQIGEMEILDNQAYIYDQLRQNFRRQITEMLILFVLLAVGLALTLRLIVLTPLCKLNDALMHAIASKDVVVHNPLRGLHDEFEDVAASVVALSDRLSNDMQLILESRSELLQEKEKTEQALVNLKQTQDALLQSEKQASLGALVSGVAHEVNTPLGVIVTSVTCINERLKVLRNDMNQSKLTRSAMEEGLEQLATAAELITHNAARASTLISNFKLLAKESSTEHEKNFNLSDYLLEVLHSLQPRLERAEIQLAVDIQPQIQLVSMPGLFHQLLTGLLSNVIEHAYPLGQGGTCQVRLFERGGIIFLQCDDQGLGIEPEQQKHIFDPFFTTKLGAGSSGLGLAIVYRIVHSNMHGQISVNSLSPQGTRFEIQIPL